MPFLDDSDQPAIDLSGRVDVPKGFAVTPGAVDLEDGSQKPQWNWGAAFRRNNELAALAASNSYWTLNDAEPDFNPWDKIKGTPDEANFARLATARNERMFNSIKSDIARETEDRKLLDSQPWWMGLVTEGTAGILSPTSLIPGGSFVKGAKGGIAVVKAGARVGAANAVSAAIQEAALQNIEQTRTASESATAIGASLFLGGLLGAGGQALLSKGEWQRGIANLDHDLAGVKLVPDARPVFDDVFSQLKATGMADEEARVNASVFAARYAARAERLGEGATPLDVYRGDGLEVRRVAEPPVDLVQSLGVSPGEVLDRTFNQNEIQAAIRAYHGSPHDFERFDLSKIGTGEGAQAYGHGLYFAEREGVAKSYRDALSEGGLEINGKRIAADPGTPEDMALAAVQDAISLNRHDPISSAVTHFMVMAERRGPMQDKWEAAKNVLLKWDEEGAKPVKGGRMYEVSIKADPAHFLDWDKPLSRQAPEVQEKLKQVMGSNWDEFKFADAGDAVRNGLISAGAEGVSSKMQSAGIPGIKYLDQSSRDHWAADAYVTKPDEDGRYHVNGASITDSFATREEAQAALDKAIGSDPVTRNYVVFDDNLIDVVRKYQMADKSVDPRGRITIYKDNSAVIDLFSKADQSTFMHEAGHLWLNEMVRDAAKSPGIKADLDQITKWLGVSDASKIELKHHEQFARGFEEYLRDGKAPSSALAKAFESFKQWLTAIYKNLTDLGPDHVKINNDVRGVMDRMLATDREIAARDVGPSGALRSVGAAANEPIGLEGNTIAGGAARATAAATARLNPLLRALHSPSAAYREIMMNTVENPIYLTKNFEGVASQPAVETLMKEYNGGLAKAIQSTNDAYLEHRKAGGQMDREEFREAVGRAMRRGDSNPDPVVTKTAQEWRQKVFEPLKEQAIKAGLLPKDVSVDTAQSYFTRMWNSRKISADEQGFKGMVQDWAERQVPQWAEQFDKAAERRLNPLHQEISALEMEKTRRAEDLKQRADVADTSEMTEGDIRQALRIVQGGAPRPKGIKTLSQFVLDAGGLVDDAGELAHRGITNKARPGLVRRERRTVQSDNGGWTLDDMARHAWENGYFPENSQRPSIDQFVEALNDDFHKVRAVVKRGDEEAFRLHDLVSQLEADLARAGVGTDGKPPRFSTSEEMKGAVERVYKALDAEADRKLAVLKDKLNERQADIRVDRESRFLGDPKELAKGIADEVFDTLSGRTGQGVRNDFLTIKARGPLKERTFNIEDLFQGSNGRAVEDYLEHDVEHVGRRYTRIMGADVELARKFGSVDMAEQIMKVRDDYRNLRAGITDEKQLLALEKRERSDISDLEAVRDMLRGTNPGASVDANYSRIVRAVNHFNYLRSMGEVAIASLTETVRPAMVHGLLPYMETLGQTLTNLKGIKASVADAQLAGVVTERVLGTRLATLSEIIDPYASRGPVEAFLENMTNIASRWNGIRLLTDMQKSIAAVITQNRILEGATKFPQIKDKEKAYLAYLGIDQGMAERIAKQFAEHGETIDKVNVANHEKWDDEVAARTYRAALSKDVDSIITTKGVADVPSFANTPQGRAILQFKSFALASHQRVLLRGLQEGQARFVGGIIAMTVIGMMATWFKALSGNRTEKLADFTENPGWWISEGLDRAGIFAVPMELANTFEKATGFNPIKTPIKMGDKTGSISQKNQNRNAAGALFGPTVGLAQDAFTVAGLPKKLVDGEEVTAGDKNAIERLVPFSSYPGIRTMLKYVVNPPAN